MPNPYLEWTDAIGLARVTCLVPILNGWTPDVEPIGPSAVTLGGGVTYLFPFRTDYTVRFTMPYLGALQMTEVLRLKNWLLNGGTITLFTGDLAARIYTCRLRPGTTPQLTQDPQELEFALALELLNTAAAPLVASWQDAGVLLTPDTDFAALGGTFTRSSTATFLSGP